MNLASALLKQIISLQDGDTWSLLRKHYLPAEYHSLFNAIEKHSEKFHRMPTFEDLKLSIRDGRSREKLFAIEAQEIDVEPYFLLEYLKNEYTQREILAGLDNYIDNSVSFESAEESLTSLYNLILDVEDKVELENPSESMQRIPLFDDEAELARYLPLGFNEAFDSMIKFSPHDLILVGGHRGSGKSITCANLANNVYNSGKSAVYFTIEMDSRETLQRHCSIATGVPFSRLRTRTLGVGEWEKVAIWWAQRFLGSSQYLDEYREHRDFEQLHNKLTTKCELDPVRQIDIVYDPALSVSKIRSEIDKKIKSQMDLGVIIVDYVNQVHRHTGPAARAGGQYDWKEQIEVSKALKAMAQEYEVPVFSPYQTDGAGEARFAKGLLDAADAAFILNGHSPEDGCISFTCSKMRNAKMTDFTSTMDWETLKIGPESALSPSEREENEQKTGESINDL